MATFSPFPSGDLEWSGSIAVGNVTGVAGQIQLYDPAAGQTIEFPASPTNNAQWSLKNATTDTTQITLDGNGNTFEQLSDGLQVSSGGYSSFGGQLDYKFLAATGWILIGG